MQRHARRPQRNSGRPHRHGALIYLPMKDSTGSGTAEDPNITPNDGVGPGNAFLGDNGQGGADEPSFLDPAFDFTPSDLLTVPDADEYSFGNGLTDSPFSISGLAYMDDATNFTILSKDGASGSREYYLGTTSADRIAMYCLHPNASQYIGRFKVGTVTGDQGSWVHWVGTYDGSRTDAGLKIYRNAVRVDDTNGGSASYEAMTATSQPVKIGARAALFSNGRLQNVALWGRCLTQEDVSRLYSRDMADLA